MFYYHPNGKFSGYGCALVVSNALNTRRTGDNRRDTDAEPPEILRRTTAFNLACTRSDSSNSVAEMPITFHSGSSHTMKMFWQNGGASLIAHIWSVS